MLLKCHTQYVSKLGKLSSGHRTGKGQFSFRSQRRAMPKNVQTTLLLLLFHLLGYVKVMLKLHQARLYQYMNHVHAGFRKGKRNQRSNCQHPLNHRKYPEYMGNPFGKEAPLTQVLPPPQPHQA